jgi:N-ATPase, AtpR subunit
MLVSVALGATAMTTFDGAHWQSFAAALAPLAWLVIGALIGRFHFLTLQWSVGKLATGRSWASTLVIQFFRFGVLAALLGLTARSFGAIPMLIVTAGVLLARSVIFRSGALQP